MPFMENFVLMDGENGKKWYLKEKGRWILFRPVCAVRESAACASCAIWTGVVQAHAVNVHTTVGGSTGREHVPGIRFHDGRRVSRRRGRDGVLG